jgi:hypothetical protein
MNDSPSPIKAFELAWKDMVAVLFAPFDYVKWLILGVPLFMINCGSGGGGGNFNFNMGGPGGGPGRNPAEEVVQWVDQNIALVGIIIGALVMIILLTAVIASFLHSRGIFMLINLLSGSEFKLGQAWNLTSKQGNSFFLYQLFITFMWMVVPLIYVLLVLGWPFFRSVLLGEYGFAEIMAAMSVVLVYGALVLFPLWLLNIVIRNFGIPIMAAKNLKVLPATMEAFGVMASHIGASILYLLFLFVLTIAGGGVMIMVGCLLVCLIVGCIPVVGQYVLAVVTAPISVFMWCYTLRFVEQFGDQYRVLPEFLGQPTPPEQPDFTGYYPPPEGSDPSSGAYNPPSWPPAPMPPMPQGEQPPTQPDFPPEEPPRRE